MIQVNYEGTPVGNILVQPFNPGSPIYWEAGAVGMLDSQGRGVVSDGYTGAYGFLADRRSTVPGIADATFLPSSVGQYGDETFFNQPGYGNSLYGTLAGPNGETLNAVIPINTIPTTSNLIDETSANVNSTSRYVTMYTRGGNYATDQFDSTQVYTGGQKLYVMQDGSGRLTNVQPGSNPLLVGQTEAQLVDGNGLLHFKSLIV